MKYLLLLTLSLIAGEIYGQGEIERTNSIWGKLALEQIFPDRVHSGEVIAINYRAFDVNDVTIALCGKDGEAIQSYDDLSAGIGQIKIRKELPPGKYMYALLVNGRLIERRKFEVIGSVAKN